MARQTNGTNQSLQSASALSFGNPDLYAISYWMYVDSWPHLGAVAMEYDTTVSNGSTTQNEFVINMDSSTSSKIRVVLQGLGGGQQIADITQPSAAAWHHYVLNVNISLATNCIVSFYIDGTSQSLTRSGTGVFTGDAIADKVLYLMARNNTSVWLAGRIADLAIWTTINLAQGDVDNLNGGTLPTSVQSGNLIYYWKLCGTASPETPSVGAINMTVNSATNVAHPSAISSSCVSGTRSSMLFLGV